MEVVTLQVGLLRTNCYLIFGDTRKVSIVDPGDDTDYITNIIADKELTPEKIIITHGHSDHTSSALELSRIYNIAIYINKKDKFLMGDIGKISTKIKIVDLSRSSNISLGGRLFSLISTPGHTPGGMCLYSKEENMAITGDLIFSDGLIGRYDLHYSRLDELIDSIDRLLMLSSKTLIYPGHGGSFVLDEFALKFTQLKSNLGIE